MTDYQAVLFDLDGTLLDTAADLGGALNLLLAEQGQPTLPPDSIRPHVSNGGNALVRFGFNTEPDSDEHQALYLRLLDIYGDNLSRHTQPFAGIQPILDWLGEQRLPWGIVTNKPSRYTLPLMADLALTPAPATTICPDDVSRTKPDPEPLFLACEQIGCAPQQAIYVGDHERDIEAGRRAGMVTIAASYGYIVEDDDPTAWGADYLAADTAQLFEQLTQLITATN